jgi:hypothetical protein
MRERDMRADRVRRALVPCATLLLLAIAVPFAGMLMPGAAGAAAEERPSPRPARQEGGNVVVKFGESVRVAEDQVVETVVVFGGNATIAGTVTDEVVVLGGNVRVLSTAVVGSQMATDDASVVAMGGTITVEPGASVTGQRVDAATWESFANMPDVKVWGGFSFFGWLVWTAVLVVLGLVAAALLPRQMTTVGRMVARRPGASLGWGALTFFVIVPVAAVLLLITIIGIFVLIPGIVVVPLFYFFASISVATLIVQRLMKNSERQQNLMLATSLGIVGTSVVAQIPVAGTLAVLVMVLFGTGGAVLALLERRQERRMQPAPVGGPQGGVGHTLAPPQPPEPSPGGAAYAPTPEATTPDALPQEGVTPDAESPAPSGIGVGEPPALVESPAPSGSGAPTPPALPPAVAPPTAPSPPAAETESGWPTPPVPPVPAPSGEPTAATTGPETTTSTSGSDEQAAQLPGDQIATSDTGAAEEQRGAADHEEKSGE